MCLNNIVFITGFRLIEKHRKVGKFEYFLPSDVHTSATDLTFYHPEKYSCYIYYLVTKVNVNSWSSCKEAAICVNMFVDRLVST